MSVKSIKVMRPGSSLLALFVSAASALLPGISLAAQPVQTEAAASAEQKMLRAIYSETLKNGAAYDRLCTLVANHPGRLAGSKSLEGAIEWSKQTLETMQLDRVYTQDVTVPHWERGSKESVMMVGSGPVAPLAAIALGGSAASPKDGVQAEVIEVRSIDELNALGRDRVQGKIVFFNRPMDPTQIRPGAAYGGAGDQRMRGAAAASRLGAVASLVRSLTFSRDDVPHTGVVIFPADVQKIPAAALSTLAADKLSAAIVEGNRTGAPVQVRVSIHARWLPDAPSRNVIGEIRGTEFPDEVIVIGAHTDCWDNSPGAHDDGAGMVQAMEVLRTFRALGIKPRHTVRCVLFVNEENGTAGALAYAAAAKASKEKHVLAIESDGGGFDPRGFSLVSNEGDPAAKAARWLPLFREFGIVDFRKDHAGVDVTPLKAQGVTVGELVLDSQRYFDVHHAASDTIDKVNPRELHLGAAAMASLVWLVDTQGL